MSEAPVVKEDAAPRLITDAQSVEAVLVGKKRAVRRNSRLAQPGDTFMVGEQRFVVTEVYQQALGEMSDADAQAEGFETLDAYKAFILGMHRGMPWVPTMKVWVHEFAAAAGVQ